MLYSLEASGDKIIHSYWFFPLAILVLASQLS
jgi:hypothetical protein